MSSHGDNVAAGAAGGAARGGPMAVLGWAAFLACSWTWCIGMFLPVLLMRDYGVWSWVVFAVPNCVGAAGLAWWMTNRERAEATLEAHRHVIDVFSAVTVAFQSFFAAWLVLGNGLSRDGWWLIGAFMAPLVLGWVFGTRGRGLVRVAVIVWIASVGLALAWWMSLTADPARTMAMPPPQRPIEHVGPLAAVCAVGFIACPLLDRTFYLARLALPEKPAKMAFGVGFGVLFAAMVGITLLYAPTVIRAAESTGLPIAPVMLPLLLAIHVAVQLSFTMFAHASTDGAGLLPKSGLASAPLVGGLIGAAAFHIPRDAVSFIGNGELAATEIVYRSFMAFYGLVFPAYVWMAMIGRWSETPSRGVLVRVGVVIVAALPFYAVAFLWREMWWAVPGVAIVLAGRLLVAQARVA